MSPVRAMNVSDAGGHDQRGERAHHADADERARALLVAGIAEPRLDEARHLDGEGAEHRGGEHHEQQHEWNEDQRLIEDGLQIQAAADVRREHAHRDVNGGNSRDIRQRQHEAASGRHARTATRDDSRQDRHHRQDARRERHQQSTEVADRHGEQDAAARDLGRETVLLRNVSTGIRRGGGAAGRHVFERDRKSLRDRRIAQARIGAALVRHLHVDALRIRRRHRERGVEALAVNLLLPEIFVAVRFAFRQHDVADRLRRIRGLELDALLVEVITVGDAPVESDVAGGTRVAREHERHFGIEIFVFAGRHWRSFLEDFIGTDGGLRGRDHFDRRIPHARRIAQARVGAALPLEFQRDRVAGLRAGERRTHLEGVAEDFLFAEVLVLVDLGFGVNRFADGHSGRRRREPHPLLVEVVALRGLPLDRYRRFIGGGGVFERLGRVEELVFSDGERAAGQQQGEGGESQDILGAHQNLVGSKARNPMRHMNGANRPNDGGGSRGPASM
jgi:hypothetical protein